METSLGFEIISLIILTAILLFDVFRSFKNPKVSKSVHHIAWVAFYALLAIIFGGIVWSQYGATPAIEFYSGWLTEYSLSIDNLFVFVMILASFKVPKELQKEALGVGILIALVLRGIFIFIGGALIERFTWIFYIFGAFLIYTAIKLLVDQEGSEEYHENAIVKFFHKILPMTEIYDGGKVRTQLKGKDGIYRKAFTPLLIVFISLGVTDLFFAFDSIPAIFGLTKDPFIVFTANIFALMGLQQLFFLLGKAVEKLKFLPLGIAIILAFIGVELIFEALHGSGVEWVPEIPTIASLLVIIITISCTAIASVLKIRRDARIGSNQA